MINQKQSLFLVALIAGTIGAFCSAVFSVAYARAKGPVRATNEIIVPAEGLSFVTEDGKPIAKIRSLRDTYGQRNTFSLFNQAGNREVELNAFVDGGDVSVFDAGGGGAAVSVFATPNGGQLTLMGDIKSAIQMSSGKDGGVIRLNESGGLPVLILEAASHRGRIEIQENGGPEPKPLWRAP